MLYEAQGATMEAELREIRAVPQRNFFRPPQRQPLQEAPPPPQPAVPSQDHERMLRARERLRQEEENDPVQRSYRLHRQACERRLRETGSEDDGFTDGMLAMLGRECSLPGSRSGSVITLGSRAGCYAPFADIMRASREMMATPSVPAEPSRGPVAHPAPAAGRPSGSSGPSGSTMSEVCSGSGSRSFLFTADLAAPCQKVYCLTIPVRLQLTH